MATPSGSRSRKAEGTSWSPNVATTVISPGAKNPVELPAIINVDPYYSATAECLLDRSRAQHPPTTSACQLPGTNPSARLSRTAQRTTGKATTAHDRRRPAQGQNDNDMDGSPPNLDRRIFTFPRRADDV